MVLVLLRTRHESMTWVFKRRHILVPQRQPQMPYDGYYVADQYNFVHI